MSDADRQPLALVIDDEESIRQIAGMALRADGWRVDEAADGREGLKLAREHKPSLIVVDMMLPSMSGVEVCRKASQDPALAHAAFLMISGMNEKASALVDFWELPLKTRDFMKKPFELADLTRRARQLVAAAGLAAPPAPTNAPKAPESKATEPKAAESKARAPRAMPDEPSFFPKLPKALAKPAPPREGLRPAPERPVSPPPASPSRPAAPSRPIEPTATITPSTRPAASPGRFSLLAGGDEHPRGYRVLIIDDDEDIRVIFQAHLSRFHIVETAVNGMEGLKAMESFRPDFVVTDVNMPVMNGLETAEAIRQHPVFFEVPIFFVTGETDAALPRKAYEIGGNLYLRKPIDPERLLKCIDYFLKETRLGPGAYLVENIKAAKSASAPAKASVVGPALPRVLVVDFNIEDHHLLKRVLGEEGRGGLAPGGPLEIFWVENPRAALGNLTRWEPDVVFYNPRNPNMDAIAFGQTLRLNKELGKAHLWLIGARFYDADANYSRHSLGHDVIRLDQDDATLAEALGKALVEARSAGLRPKAHSWQELRAEEVERLRQLQQSDARRARERDLLRKRYRSVQEFIDQTLQ